MVLRVSRELVGSERAKLSFAGGWNGEQSWVYYGVYKSHVVRHALAPIRNSVICGWTVSRAHLAGGWIGTRT